MDYRCRESIVDLFGSVALVAIALFIVSRAVPAIAEWRNSRNSYNVSGLVRAVNCGRGCWAAAEHGSCCACGHEWEPGEIIGTVTQEYELQDDGSVVHRPGVRLACVVCVARTRREGDLSLQWAREAGLR